jgi:hypothetical protein
VSTFKIGLARITAKYTEAMHDGELLIYIYCTCMLFFNIMCT